MKRFLITSAVLAVLIVASWVKVIPVRCIGCQKVLFNTNIASEAFGGHGECTHAECFPELCRLMEQYSFPVEPKMEGEPEPDPI